MKRILATAVALSFMLPAVAFHPPEQLLRPIEDTEDPAPAPQFKHNAKAISICDARGACTEARLPTVVGKVKRIIHGSFVAPTAATASWITMSNRYASVCYLASDGKVACAPVRSYVPKGVEISFRDMGRHMQALVFSRKAGDTTPTEEMNKSVHLFMQALPAATNAIQEHATKKVELRRTAKLGGNAALSSAKIGGGASAPLAIAEGGSCLIRYDGELTCEGGGGGSGGSGSGGGGGTWEDGGGFEETSWFDTDDGYNYDSGEPIDNSAAEEWQYPTGWVEPVEDEPEIYPDFDTEFAEPVVDQPPSPTWPEGFTTVSNTTTCVYRGMIIICTAPKAPPFYDPDHDLKPPAPPAASWKWNFCDTFGLFCNEGVREGGFRDGRTGPGSLTLEERIEECGKQYDFDLDECHAYPSDYRTKRACEERAGLRNSKCLETARNLDKM